MLLINNSTTPRCCEEGTRRSPCSTSMPEGLLSRPESWGLAWLLPHSQCCRPAALDWPRPHQWQNQQRLLCTAANVTNSCLWFLLSVPKPLEIAAHGPGAHMCEHAWHHTLCTDAESQAVDSRAASTTAYSCCTACKWCMACMHALPSQDNDCVRAISPPCARSHGVFALAAFDTATVCSCTRHVNSATSSCTELCQPEATAGPLVLMCETSRWA